MTHHHHPAAPPPAGTPPAALGPENRWRVLAVICCALSVVVIDSSVLHVATPQLAADLRPSAVELLWIIDVYPLVVAPLLVLSATLGDRFGRKRVLIAGLLIFTVASLLAAFAGSPNVLIAARVLQGFGGAAIAPATMAIIRDVFPDRDERVRAIGIWSAVMAGGAAAGPIVGGLLIDRFWWGAVFLVNVPVLLLVLPFAIKVLPESRSSDPPPWDPLSVAMVAAGILLLAYGIKEGARHGVLGVPGGAVVVAVALLTLFARRQLSRPNPTLDLRLFASPIFRVAVGCVMLALFAIVGLELLFAQYLQLVLGLGPAEASVRLVPLLASSIVGALLASRVLTALGPRITIAGGFLLNAAALVPMLWLTTADDYLLLLPGFLVLGAALEIALVAANDVIFASVDPDGAGQASAIEETAYELGGGIGVAVLGSVAAAIYTAGVTRDAVGPGAVAARESLPEAFLAAERLPAAAGDALIATAQTAFVDGLHAVIVVAIALTAIGGLLAAAVIGGGRTGEGSGPGPGPGPAEK